jgi:hypothetical protein
MASTIEHRQIAGKPYAADRLHIRALHVLVGTAIGLTALLAISPAAAHCIVGNRTFPATFAIDDACVLDELALPTMSSVKNGDDPSGREIEISGELAKRITENFGVAVGSAFMRRRASGGTAPAAFTIWRRRSNTSS